MALSTQLSSMLRQKLDDYKKAIVTDEEIQSLRPLLTLQAQRSHIPSANELLIEKVQSKDGFHLFFYPFEGRVCTKE